MSINKSRSYVISFSILFDKCDKYLLHQPNNPAVNLNNVFFIQRAKKVSYKSINLAATNRRALPISRRENLALFKQALPYHKTHPVTSRDHH